MRLDGLEGSGLGIHVLHLLRLHNLQLVKPVQHSKEFQSRSFKITFQFPAMRALSISSGHAFLLVFSLSCPSSLLLVKTRLEQIREQRQDFKVRLGWVWIFVRLPVLGHSYSDGWIWIIVRVPVLGHSYSDGWV
jgi:hypothetical protein